MSAYHGFSPKPERDKRYTDWVKSQMCVVRGVQADDPHHLIGHGQGGTGTKVSDYWTFPLCRAEHDELHRGWKEWEAKNGSQWRHVANTLRAAIQAGVLVRP